MASVGLCLCVCLFNLLKPETEYSCLIHRIIDWNCTFGETSSESTQSVVRAVSSHLVRTHPHLRTQALDLIPKVQNVPASPATPPVTYVTRPLTRLSLRLRQGLLYYFLCKTTLDLYLLRLSCVYKCYRYVILDCGVKYKP